MKRSIPVVRSRNQEVSKLFLEVGKSAFHLALQYTKNRERAKDIVQQSLVKALETTTLPNNRRAKYWFLRVVRNTALDEIKKRKTHLALNEQYVNEEALLRPMQEAENAYQDAEKNQSSKKLIETALANISVDHREIVFLKDIKEFSYLQIADILGVEKGTVMSRLHRARLALKNEVENMGYES